MIALSILGVVVVIVALASYSYVTIRTLIELYEAHHLKKAN